MLLVGPILAQVATASVAARVEGRYVATIDRHYEAAARPLAGLDVDWRHFDLTLRYGPSFTVLPVESASRELIIFHNAYLGGVYNWGRTQLEINESGGYGVRNFYALALSDPRVETVAPPPSMPPVSNPGAPGAPSTGTGSTGTGSTGTGMLAPPAAALNSQNVRFIASTSTVAVQHRPAVHTMLRAEFSYLISGAALEADRATYPLIRGPRASTTERYELTRTDALLSTQTLQYASISAAQYAWIANVSELWSHEFSRETSTQLGVGLSGTQSPAVNNFVAYSIYPTFTAGLVSATSLERGKFSISFQASAAPAIDLITAAVDPRVSFGTITSWARDRFSISLGADGSISLAAHSNLGSLSAVGAGAAVAYRLGALVSVDAGARVAYQNFQGNANIPFSQAIFVGLNFALDKRL